MSEGCPAEAFGEGGLLVTRATAGQAIVPFPG
jgi:hypothetical protein